MNTQGSSRLKNGSGLFNTEYPLTPAYPHRLSIQHTKWSPPTHFYPNQRVLVTLSGPHGTDIIGTINY